MDEEIATLVGAIQTCKINIVQSFYTDSPEGDTLLGMGIPVNGRRQSKALAFHESLCTGEKRRNKRLVWLTFGFATHFLVYLRSQCKRLIQFKFKYDFNNG